MEEINAIELYINDRYSENTKLELTYSYIYDATEWKEVKWVYSNS